MWTATVSIEFSVEELEKVYLERELGLQQANQLATFTDQSLVLGCPVLPRSAGRGIPDPRQPIRPNCSYTHKLPEAKAGATLQQADARSLAEDFFTKELGKDPNIGAFFPKKSIRRKKPNRLDWDFTWEKHGLKVKDAPYREKIHIAGINQRRRGDSASA